MNLTRTKLTALAATTCLALLAALVSFAGGATAGVGVPTPTPTPMPPEVPDGCIDASPGGGAVVFDCVQEAGLLRLHLGSSDYLRYEPDTDMDGVIDSESGGPGAPVDELLRTTGCALTPPSELVTLAAGPASAVLGQKKNSIGVRYSEGGGEPCAQVNGSSQTLTLTLGSADEVEGKLVDWAEIDIERKFDSVVRAEFFRAGTPVGVLVLGCNADLSDCGPDSGDGDNFRLDTKNPPDGYASPGPFDTLVLSNDVSGPSNGAFSLDGGADGTNPGPYGATLSSNPNDSLFNLVTIETLEYQGTLDCGESTDPEPVPSDSGATSTSVTRLANAGSDKSGNPSCGALLPYNLSGEFNEGEEQGDSEQVITFEIDTLGQDARFLWTGTWDIEDAEYPTIGATMIDYLDGNGPKALDWCGGTYDPDGTDIEAKLAGVIPIDGVGGCLITQEVVVLGGGLQVTEMVLLGRDPRMLR